MKYLKKKWNSIKGLYIRNLRILNLVGDHPKAEFEIIHNNANKMPVSQGGVKVRI